LIHIKVPPAQASMIGAVTQGKSMQIPLQVTFRNLQHSPAVEAEVRAHAERLETFHDRILGCRVVIEERHKHHRQGNHFHVTVDVTVPGAELVASREPDAHHRYTDVQVAIRDAFDSMRRQLEDYARKRDGRVKTHAAP
jgi:ribosome-associated translation inhibitor RaiA